MAIDEILAQRMRAILAGKPGLVEKKMFGGIGFLLQGNLACGIHGENVIVRIDPQEHETALSQEHVRPFDLTGKPMKGWIFVTPDGVKSEADLAAWVAKGVAFAGKLPPK